MDLKKTQDVKSILSIDGISKIQMNIGPVYECIDPSTCVITDSIFDESFPVTIGKSFSSEQDGFKYQELEYPSQNWIISNPNIQVCNETPGFRPTAPLDLMIGGVLPSTRPHSSLANVYIQDNNQKLNIIDINASESITSTYTLPDSSETNSQIFLHSSAVNTINIANTDRKSNDSFDVSKTSHYEEYHRREYHIANERKRRRKLQEAFTYLSSLLYCRDYPMTRMIILDTAIETIKILKAELSQKYSI